MSGGASGQGGYYYQNLVAVDHLLDLIEFGNPTIAVTLEAAASAQYVDDVVVEQPGLTQFIQVKWAEDERASITLAGLTAAEVSASGSGPSLFRKLELGFNQASSLAGGDVRIVLRSTWRPGTQRRPSDGWDRSLAEFIRDFHGPFVACDDWQLTSDHPAFGDYSAVLRKLQQAAGLDGDDAGFTRFLKRLKFDLDQPPRDACRDRLTGRLTNLGIDPARLPTLLDAVVRWSIDRRRVQAEDVLRELGLESSFSEALVQYFPVDEAGWVERPEVFAALDDAIEGIDGGYVLVAGEPGIGKSTAVARYLTERGDVSFGYYCFIPDEQSLGNERLTEAAFVRSLCAGIRSAFPDVSLPHQYADPSLRLVNEWLEALAGSDERVVIIVDGLDHVARKVQEGTLSAPLTRVLDGMPPDGVTFVLTSRSDGALPPSLQQLLALEPHRRIAIPRLTPAQVEEFLDRRGASVSAEELDIALQLSAGLPVYLEVIARTIADVHGRERETALNNSIRLGDEGIERFHGALWTEVQPQPLKRRLLALLARRTEVTAVSTLHSLVRHLGSDADLSSVEDALEELRHVLRIVDGNEVMLFHSSLGDFVRQHTADLDAQISSALLAHYESAPDSDESWRHSFHHMLELGLHSRVTELCTADWFERAWMAQRPLNEIHANISTALDCAVQGGALADFVRLSLLKVQVALLEENLDLSPYGEAALLLDLGQPAEALRRLWNGQHRTCDAVDFARFCGAYERSHGQPLPERIVKRCLGGFRPSGWSAADAADFYAALSAAVPANELVETVEAISWTQDLDGHQRHGLTTDQSEALNQLVLRALVARLMRRRDLASLDAIATSADQRGVAPSIALAGKALLLSDAGEEGAAREVAARISFEGLSRDSLRWLALSLGERGLVDHIPDYPEETPELPQGLLASSYSELDGRLMTLWGELRWAYLTDDQTMPAWVESAATALESRLRDVVVILSRVARLWVRHATRNQDPSADRVLKEALAALQNAIDRSAGDERGEVQIFRGEAHVLISQLWQCAELVLDEETFLNTAAWWATTDAASRHHEASARLARSILRGSGQGGKPLDALLAAVEKRARSDEDAGVMTPRLAECAAVAGLAGRDADVTRLWRDLLDAGRGVYWRKDYQFNEILVPLAHAHQADPDRTLDRVGEQFALAHRLANAARSRTAAVAVHDLIAFVAEQDPGLGLKALTELEDLLWRTEALHHALRALRLSGVEHRLLSALIGTMDRWRDHSDFDDHTKPALVELMDSCLANGDVSEAERLYRRWRPILLVEKGAPEVVRNLAQRWTEHAEDLPTDLTNDTALASERPVDSPGSSRWDSEERSTIEARLDQAEDDLATIRDLIEELDHEEIQRSRRQQFERSLTELADGTARIAGAPDDEIPDLRNRLAASLEPDILERGGAQLRAADVRDLVSSALLELTDSEGNALSIADLDTALDIDEWARDLARPPGLPYFVESALRQRVLGWVASASYDSLDQWDSFVRSRSSDVASTGLLAIASRLVTADPARSERLLSDVLEDRADSLFMDRERFREVAEVALKLNPSNAAAILMKAFTKYHDRYPRMAIYNLSTLLKELAGIPDYPAVDVYEHFATHNRVLMQGLSGPDPDLSWLQWSKEPDPMRQAAQYLMDLLEYPVVDVRILALKELFDLASERPELVDYILELWPDLSRGTQEYALVALGALAETARLNSRQFDDLVKMVEPVCHQGIRVSIRDLASALKRRGIEPDPLTSGAAERLVSSPALLIRRAPLSLGQSTWIPRYLAWVIETIGEACGIDLRQRLFDLLPLTFGDVRNARELEAATHRQYNINTNFDTIEIEGAYGVAARLAVNEGLRQSVEEHEIPAGRALDLSPGLRIADPSDLVYQPDPEPLDPRWVGEGISDEEFLAFADLDTHVVALAPQGSDWVTVFEHCERRRGEEIAERLNRVTKVRVFTFLWPDGIGQPHEHMVEAEVLGGSLRGRSFLYRAEIAAELPQPGATGLTPVTVHSHRTFRGRVRTDLAALNPEVASSLAPADGPDPFALRDRQELVVRSSEWQGPFDQGRRRHEPRSAGFLLEVKRAWLALYCEGRGMSCWTYVSLERTTDRYMPEVDMKWSRCSDLRRLELG